MKVSIIPQLEYTCDIYLDGQLYGRFGSDDATNALVNLGIGLDNAESLSQGACYRASRSELKVQCDFEDRELENMRLERESF